MQSHCRADNKAGSRACRKFECMFLHEPWKISLVVSIGAFLAFKVKYLKYSNNLKYLSQPHSSKFGGRVELFVPLFTRNMSIVSPLKLC